MSKKQIGLRVSVDTVKELESLANKYKVSQADVVAVLVRCAYMGEFEGDIIDKLFDIAARC